MSSLKNEAALPWGRSLTHLVWCILLICRLCINRFEYLGMPSLWLMDFRWSSRHDWKWLLVMSGRCSKVFWRPCMTSREPAIFVPTRLVDGLWNFNLIIWGIHLVLEQIHQRYWEPTLLQTREQWLPRDSEKGSSTFSPRHRVFYIPVGTGDWSWDLLSSRYVFCFELWSHPSDVALLSTSA